MVSCVIGPTLSEALVAFGPDQPPDAAQLVTLALVHDRVVLVLRGTPGGFAVRLTEGSPAVTVTTAARVTVPPVPAHANVKLELAARAPVLCVPEVPLAPLQSPDAEQLVAFVVLHVRFDELPDCTLAGDAVRVSVGGAAVTATAAVCETEPPAPVHVSV